MEIQPVTGHQPYISNNSITIKEIPFDVVKIIFEFLSDPRDLQATSLTCKEWTKISQNMLIENFLHLLASKLENKNLVQKGQIQTLLNQLGKEQSFSYSEIQQKLETILKTIQQDNLTKLFASFDKDQKSSWFYRWVFLSKSHQEKTKELEDLSRRDVLGQKQTKVEKLLQENAVLTEDIFVRCVVSYEVSFLENVLLKYGPHITSQTLDKIVQRLSRRDVDKVEKLLGIGCRATPGTLDHALERRLVRIAELLLANGVVPTWYIIDRLLGVDVLEKFSNSLIEKMLRAVEGEYGNRYVIYRLLRRKNAHSLIKLALERGAKARESDINHVLRRKNAHSLIKLALERGAKARESAINQVIEQQLPQEILDMLFEHIDVPTTRVLNKAIAGKDCLDLQEERYKYTSQGLKIPTCKVSEETIKTIMRNGGVPSNDTLNLAIENRMSNEIIGIILDRLLEDHWIPKGYVVERAIENQVAIDIVCRLLVHVKDSTAISSKTLIQAAKYYEDEALIKKMMTKKCERMSVEDFHTLSMYYPSST